MSSIKHIGCFFGKIDLVLYVDYSTCTFVFFDMTAISFVGCLVHHQVVRQMLLLLRREHLNIHHCILSLLLLWIILLLHHFFLDLLGPLSTRSLLHHCSISFIVGFRQTSILIGVFHKRWTTLMSTNERWLGWGMSDLFDPPKLEEIQLFLGLVLLHN